MSELKATPGPWTFYAKLSGSENHRGYCVHGASIDYWALAEVQPGDEDGDLGRANAALIAAAPELYAALKNALPYLWSHNGQGSERAVKLAEAALKKARGE